MKAELQSHGQPGCLHDLSARRRAARLALVESGCLPEDSGDMDSLYGMIANGMA
jgi:hypothetical protein